MKTKKYKLFGYSLKELFGCIGIVLSIIFMGAEPFGLINIIGLSVLVGITIPIIKNQNKEKQTNKTE